MSKKIAEIFNRSNQNGLVQAGELGRMLDVLKQLNKKTENNYWIEYQGKAYLPDQAERELRRVRER